MFAASLAGAPLAMAGKAEGLQATIDGMKRELSRLRGQEDLCASVVDQLLRP